MNYKKVGIWFLLILLSFSFGFVADVPDNLYEISKNLDIFGRLYREINTLYVEDTDPEKLMRTGIDAMLESLDPYTNYISEEEIEDVRFMSTGQYGGIGALIGKRKNRMIIMEPYEGYPADKAGLKAGDELIKVNQSPIVAKDMEVADVRELLRGDKDTEVTLFVNREGQDSPLEVKLFRDQIKIKNVPFSGMVEDGVGYIALTGFTQDAGKEVQDALQNMKREQPAIKGVILDLRDNPGGRLDQAVRIANVFIPQKETIVETRGRIDNSTRVHTAQRVAVDTEIPLAVLVNQRSASASEIVAGAIQDLDRGIVLGTRSFGKGLVQNIRPLVYNTQIKITTAKYYTPSGRCIQAINYAERNEDGSVSKIPDSLQTAFRTRNGRTVYDGGGIEPDFAVEAETYEIITRELNAQGLIFDFATQYTAKHPTIAPAREFKLTDEIYNEFVAYVRARDFTYETQADLELKRLKRIIEEEAYEEILKDNLASITDKLGQQKKQELGTYKDEISWLIKREIVKRYYYKQGLIEASFDRDPVISKAAEVLKDPTLYSKTLQGKGD
ncbi:MAG: S41 family peptidase [Bacteroidota bacterium]